MKTLRELTGTEGTPWAVQAYLTQKITGLQGEWSVGQRERLVDFLSSSYLTYPYFKEKIEELNRLAGGALHGSMKCRRRKAAVRWNLF